ncbi:secondary thiamine-phosphate synthase enzyme YjbQ [Clostridium sp. MB40-C1]|uniref:secondary thiamine-phosphate synthase enzyme YjbQ n=1 Tax=Clostridium sp. MB40-C1 TaxID=3070996 RepID=UPI0027E0E856|nr:secondary thiamine-phosphate synthase enzyme YjbQ [Clostridium sp. MB40-C1]WMJ81768.1 secondary thiamine-phosphate synthase enzyme YjbQ [Clostridium sp. MB40-C1]
MNTTLIHKIKTTRSEEFINITYLVEKAVRENNIENGVVIVFCPHTTAGITINENADPDVVRDIIVTLDELIPIKGNYKHFEGNSHAHLKASYMGSSATLIIEKGTLLTGTWQGIYFCEFDGPRNRNVYIKIIEG